MAKDVLRTSQVVGLFGPGAMVDLPDRSVIVSGLDSWDMKGPQVFKIIEEPRLTEVLRERLKSGWAVAGGSTAVFADAANRKHRSSLAVAKHSGSRFPNMVHLRRSFRRGCETAENGAVETP